jgi:hypothetical protein
MAAQTGPMINTDAQQAPLEYFSRLAGASRKRAARFEDAGAFVHRLGLIAIRPIAIISTEKRSN